MSVKQKPRLSEESARIALERSDGFCACGCGRKATQWHHIFSQSRIKGWPELADEPDCIVAVAEICHYRHTQAMRRFPRSICVHAERLAVTPQMKSFLARTYPDRFDEAHARLKRELPNAGGQGVQSSMKL